MVTCYLCQGEFEELEDWGSVNLCSDCAEKYRLKWKKRPRNSRNITIEKPRMGENASYNPGTGDIELCTFTSFKDTFRIINHEFIHFILHKLVSVKGTYQYDNIKLEVDPYHSLS